MKKRTYHIVNGVGYVAPDAKAKITIMGCNSIWKIRAKFCNKGFSWTDIKVITGLCKGESHSINDRSGCVSVVRVK